ncbi:MAG: DUF7948 domain-containing protein [Bacteroidia bacterium]
MIKALRLFVAVFTVNAFCAFAADDNPSYVNYIKNKGQFDLRSLYEANFKGGHIYLERNAFTYVFFQKDGLERLHHDRNARSANALTMQFHAVKMEFSGSLSSVTTEERDLAPYYHNYYRGKDPSKWASNVPVASTVFYHDLYKGISVKTFSSNNNIRYDFLVGPDGDPADIKMKFTGQDKLHISEGNLVINTSVGEIRQEAPYAYQVIDGVKVKIDCKYKLTEENNLSFEIAGYDHTKTLIIDPTLVFATFTGSTGDNWGMSASYDNLGNGYSTGIIFATGYPLSPGAFQQTFNGGVTNNTYQYLGFDMTASKFSSSGTNLLFSTYLGGTDNEQPLSIIVDNNNDLLIFGRSYSSDFPVTAGAYDVSINGGADITITKFNPTGTALLASTFVGGSADDAVNWNAIEARRGNLKYNYADDGRGDIILDKSNNVYIASCTISNNFPVTPGCYKNTLQGQQDACVFKMDANLSTLVWSTYLGGSLNDAGYSLGLDNANTVYVTGGTESTNFPTTPGTLHPTYQGNIDGFLTHLSANGSSVLHSTYIGTSKYDQSYFVQLDNNFNVYIYGQTEGAYPVTSGVYSNPNSGQFIHAFDPTLSSSIFSTVFGTGSGLPDIAPSAFLVDKCSNIYVAGWGGVLGQCYDASTGAFSICNQPASTTNGLPVTSNAFQTTTDGMDFYFMVLQPYASALWYATYFGGTNGSEEHVDGGTSRYDKSGVIYQAICEGCAVNPATNNQPNSDMPTTPGAWSSTNQSNNCNNALVKFSFDLLQTVASMAIAPTTAAGCAPFAVSFTNQSQNAISFVWNFGDGASATTTNASHTYTTPGNYTVSLVAKDTLSCNILDTIFATITVYPQPTITVNSPTVCAGATTTLNASGASTYTWNTGATTASTNQTPNVTTSYTVIGTDSHTCKDTAVTSITINSSPTVTATGTTLCTGSTATLTANGAATYTWSTASTNTVITVSPTSSTHYTVTGTNVSGCTDTAIAFVVVNASPTLTVNNPSICIGATATLVVSGGATYTWNTGATNDTLYLTPAATTTYSVTGVNANGCIGSATNTVTVNPLPTITAQGDTVCLGNVGTLSASGGISYTWSTGNSGSTITQVPSVTTNYTVTGMDNHLCVNTATTSIIVNVTPTLTVNNDTICRGGTATLTALASGANTYTWNTGANTSSIQVSPPVTTQYTVSSSNGVCATKKTCLAVININNTQIVGTNTAICTGGTITLSTSIPYSSYSWSTGQTTHSIVVGNAGTYIVNTIDNHGCPGADTISLLEYSPVGWPMPDTAICEGQNVFLQEIPGYAYYWHPSSWLSNGTIYNPVAAPPISITYSVDVINGPCITTQTVHIQVNPLPHLTVTPNFYDILPGESVTLNASSRDSIFWSPAYGLSCTNCPHPVVNTDDDITYMAVSGDLTTGCMDTAYVKIIVEGAFYVPNTFTPNYNGLNDVFKPVATNVYDYRMDIYDRWGNHLFTTTDIDYGWNGFYKGQLCQEDVYVYKIEYSQKHTKNRQLLKGHINLVR